MEAIQFTFAQLRDKTEYSAVKRSANDFASSVMENSCEGRRVTRAELGLDHLKTKVLLTINWL
jgi:hypothetical protein